MRIAIFSLIMCMLLLLPVRLTGQKTKSKGNIISYISSLNIRNNIPVDLAPYLTGLLLSNKNIKSDTNSLKSAADIWINKYQELNRKISLVSNPKKKNACLTLLNHGDFTEVEAILNITTNYKALQSVFPSAFQSQGNESPVIIGDYNNITYVVNQIDIFKLPEELLPNLLAEIKYKVATIKAKSAIIGVLTDSLKIMDNIISDWVDRYHNIEKELISSPSSINKKAISLFQKGDLDGAIKVLGISTEDKKSLANLQLLKVKILLLQLNTKPYDSTIFEISRAYELAVLLNPSYSNCMEMGNFYLTHFSNYNEAIKIYKMAMDSAKTAKEEVTAGKSLANAYSFTDKLKAKEIIEKSLLTLEKNEGNIEENLHLRAALLFESGILLSDYHDTCKLKMANQNIIKAIQTIEKITPLTKELAYTKITYEHALGINYFYLKNNLFSSLYLNKCRNSLERNEYNSPDETSKLLTIYTNLAILENDALNYPEANIWLHKVIGLAKNYRPLGSAIIYGKLIMAYKLLINNLDQLHLTDSSNYYENYVINNWILPFSVYPNSIYNISRCEFIIQQAIKYQQKDKLDKAMMIFQKIYDFYKSNQNFMIAAKFNFIKLIFHINEYYINSSQFDAIIHFNNELGKIILKYEENNNFGFIDIDETLCWQMFEIYLRLGNKREAEDFILKAMKVSGDQILKNPFEKLPLYRMYVGRYCLLLQQRKEYIRVDSITENYIQICQRLSSSTSKCDNQNINILISEEFGILGETIYTNVDSLQTRDEFYNSMSYYKALDCFRESFKYYNLSQKDIHTNCILSYYLSSRLSLQKRMISACSPKYKKFFQSQFDSLLEEAKKFLAEFCHFPETDGLAEKLVQLGN